MAAFSGLILLPGERDHCSTVGYYRLNRRSCRIIILKVKEHMYGLNKETSCLEYSFELNCPVCLVCGIIFLLCCVIINKIKYENNSHNCSQDSVSGNESAPSLTRRVSPTKMTIWTYLKMLCGYLHQRNLNVYLKITKSLRICSRHLRRLTNLFFFHV